MGCKAKNSNTSTSTIQISVDLKETRRISISEFADSVRFIKLETTGDNLISYVTKVFFDDGKIIIADEEAHQILIFDETGKFINKISRVGRGPQEYIGTSAVLYDPAQKNVMVYDGMSHKILFYDLNGAFIRSIDDFSNKALIRKVINLPDGNFLCYTFDYPESKTGENGSGLWMVDQKGNFVRSFFTYKDQYPAVFTFENSNLNIIEGGIGISDAIFCDLYHFEKDSLFKYISYDIRNSNLEALKGVEYSPDNGYVQVMSVQEKGNYIISYWNGSDSGNYFSLYDKVSGKFSVATSDDFDFIHSGLSAVPGWFFRDTNRQDIFLVALSSKQIETHLADEGIPRTTKDVLNGLLQGMSKEEIASMNPVLELLHIKNRK